MPTYEYRCNTCGRDVTLVYKTYAEYDDATPTCTYCASTDLKRLISRVGIARPSKDFTKMSSNEMLSVMEGGDSHEMGEMMKQIVGDSPEMGSTYHDAADRLLKGDKPEAVERDLQAQEKAVKPKTGD